MSVIASVVAGAWAYTNGLDSDPSAVDAAVQLSESSWGSAALWGPMLIGLAVAVSFYAGQASRRSASRERSGVGRAAGGHTAPAFGAVTQIRDATTGVRTLEVEIASAQPPLQGRLVYHRALRSAADTAAATELLFMRDASGQIAVPDLEAAVVEEAVEAGEPTRRRADRLQSGAVRLYVGDRVRIVGAYETELVTTAGAADTDAVYGTMRGAGMRLRLLQRGAGTSDLTTTDDSRDGSTAPAPAPDAAT